MEISHSNILIVVAHPDDEVLGMGASITKFVNQNCKVFIAFLSDGVTSRNNQRESAQERKLSAQNCAEFLKVEKVFWGNFPDNQFDSDVQLEINRFVERLVQITNPAYIFTHHINDLNIDHRKTAEACLVACRPKAKSEVKGLFSFEVVSSTNWNFFGLNFKPNLYLDVTQYINNKMEALKFYNIEMDEYPNARSYDAVYALSQYRGTTVGFQFAEAFEIILIRI